MARAKIVSKRKIEEVFDNDFPEIKGFEYSIDRIRFNSPKYVKDLKPIIPEKVLMENCLSEKRSIVSRQNNKIARRHGYRSQLDASACNDDFLEILRGYNVGVISHLEIACDLMFSKMEEAKAYAQWHDDNVIRTYNRAHIKYEDTSYRARKTRKGNVNPNYVRSYPRESKVTGMPCYHIEFTLDSSKTIRRVLKIKDHNGLTTAEDMYRMLENRYLRTKGTGLKRGVRFGDMYVQGEQYKRIANRLLKVHGKKSNNINIS